MNPYEAPQVPNNRSTAEEELPRGDFRLSRRERNPGAVKSAALFFAAVILIINVLIVGSAAGMGGWGALSMMMLVGPALNLGAGIVGLLMLPGIMKAAAGSSTALYVAAVVMLPFAAILLDVLIVQNMNLRGGC